MHPNQLLLAVFLVLEFVLWGYLLYKFIGAIFRTRSLVHGGTSYHAAVGIVAREMWYESRLIHVLKKELLVWKYALFSWRNVSEKATPGVLTLTLHKKSIYFGFFVLFVHEQVIEGVALHFWLHTFDPALAWLSTALHVYSVIWLVGDYNAIRLSRLILDNQTLTVKIGLRKEIRIPRSSIQRVQAAGETGMVYNPGDAFVASVIPSWKLMNAVGELPQLEIVLARPVPWKTFSGQNREAERVFLHLDDPVELRAALRVVQSDLTHDV